MANRKDEGVVSDRKAMRQLRCALRQYEQAMDGLDLMKAEQVLDAVADSIFRQAIPPFT